MDTEITPLLQKEPDQVGECASLREYCDNLLARSILIKRGFGICAKSVLFSVEPFCAVLDIQTTTSIQSLSH